MYYFDCQKNYNFFYLFFWKLSTFPNNLLILEEWNLCLTLDLTPHTTCMTFTMTRSSWKMPSTIFFKLNFNGSSKLNPRPIGYGVVSRDDNEVILHILVEILGNDTNNASLGTN